MLPSKRHIFFWMFFVLLLWVSAFLYTYVQAEQWIVSLEIQGIGIRHGTPENFNLWVLNTSGQEQYISGQFTDYFWIEDLEWYSTGHYTTIQCDGVHWPSWYIITWVYLKAGNTTPTLIQWLANTNILIWTWLHDYASIYSPMTYIYKPTNNTNAWIANKYWDKPRLKITIPAYAPPGTYSGTIVFSLYMY